MAWIEVHQGLWTSPKTTAFASALKIDPVYAGGLLCRLWCWAIDAAKEDGDISHLPIVEIATAAGWRKSAKTFFKALTTVHEGCTSAWVDDLGDGIYKLHDWDTYTGKLQERRRKDRERKTRVTSVGNSKGIPKENPRKVSGKSYATVPYRTTIDINHRDSSSRSGTNNARAGNDDGGDAVPDVPLLPENMRDPEYAALANQLTAFFGNVPTHMELERAEFFIKQYGREWWDRALSEASDRRSRNFGYVKSKLEAWAANGGPDNDKKLKPARSPTKQVDGVKYDMHDYSTVDKDGLYNNF